MNFLCYLLPLLALGREFSVYDISLIHFQAWLERVLASTYAILYLRTVL